VVAPGAALALLWIASAMPVWAEPAEQPPRAELRADPPTAVLHQQVLLQVEVTHPVWARPSWEPPAFEGFWAERLPSLGGPLDRDAAGTAIRTTVYRRALFPTRTGRLEIPASRIRYRDSEQEMHELEVPSGHVRVSPLPEAGRLDGFSEVVGQPAVQTYLSQTEIGEGRNLRLVVDYFGSANVWDAAAPALERALGSGVEIFAEPPRLTLGEKGGRLSARRTFRYDLVPRRRGDFEIPAFELAYFDPTSGAYRLARSEPIPFRVVHRPRGAASFPTGGSRAARSPVQLPWIPLAGAVLVIALVVSFSLWRWWRAAAGPRTASTLPSPRIAFERACDALGSDAFPALLADAVKAGIHVRHHFDARPLTTQEIASRVDDREALDLLGRLDQARFAGRADLPEALVSRVRGYLRL
jgi:hypothetical protein